MTHYMNLNPQPFMMIKNQLKTIELRLNDEKRQKIQINDYIVFTNTDEYKEQIKVKVKNIYRYNNFDDLYKSLPLDKCGYLPEELASASAKDMEMYYSAEMQNKYGVIGIEIQLTDM